MKPRLGLLAFLTLLLIVTVFAPEMIGLHAKQRPGTRAEVSRLLLSATVPAAPDPTGACAAAFVHCISLTWIAPTKDAAGNALVGTISYDVFRSTTSGSGYVKISSAAVTTEAYEDDAVTGGTTYFYVVVAYQTTSAGTSSASGNSTQTSAVGLPLPPPPPPNPPTAPQAASH